MGGTAPIPSPAWLCTWGIFTARPVWRRLRLRHGVRADTLGYGEDSPQFRSEWEGRGLSRRRPDCVPGESYGTTANGGTYGDGTVFEVTLPGAEKILHSFDNNDIDGINPYAGRSSPRELYGTTVNGGGTGSAAGIVFEMTPSGAETISTPLAGPRMGPFPGAAWSLTHRESLRHDLLGRH